MSIKTGVDVQSPLQDIESKLGNLEGDLVNKNSDAVRKDVISLNDAFSRAIMQQPNPEQVQKLSVLYDRFKNKNGQILEINEQIKSENRPLKPGLIASFFIAIGWKEAPLLKEKIPLPAPETDMKKALFLKFEESIETKLKNEKNIQSKRGVDSFTIMLSEDGKAIKEVTFKINKQGELQFRDAPTSIGDILKIAITTIEEERKVQANLETLKPHFESAGYPKESDETAKTTARDHLTQAVREGLSTAGLFSLARTGERTFTVYCMKDTTITEEAFQITPEGRFASATHEFANLEQLKKELVVTRTASEGLMEARIEDVKDSLHFHGACKTEDEANVGLKKMREQDRSKGYYLTWKDSEGAFHISGVSKDDRVSHFALTFNKPMGNISIESARGTIASGKSIPELISRFGFTSSRSDYERERLFKEMGILLDSLQGIAPLTRASAALNQLDTGARYAFLSTDSETPHRLTLTIVKKEEPSGVAWALGAASSALGGEGASPIQITQTSTFSIDNEGQIMDGTRAMSYPEFQTKYLKGVKKFEADESFGQLSEETKKLGFPIVQEGDALGFLSDIKAVLGNTRYSTESPLVLYSKDDGKLYLTYVDGNGNKSEGELAVDDKKITLKFPRLLWGFTTKTYKSFTDFLDDKELFRSGPPQSNTAYKDEIAIRQDMMKRVPTMKNAPTTLDQYVLLFGGEKANGAYAFYTMQGKESSLQDELHLSYIQDGHVLDKVLDTSSKALLEGLKVKRTKGEQVDIVRELISSSGVKGLKPIAATLGQQFAQAKARYDELQKIGIYGADQEQEVRKLLQNIATTFPEKAENAYVLVEQADKPFGMLTALVLGKTGTILPYDIDLTKEPGKIAIAGKPTIDHVAQLDGQGFKKTLVDFDAHYEKRTVDFNKVLGDLRTTLDEAQLLHRAAILGDEAPNFWCVLESPEAPSNFFISGYKKTAKGFERVTHAFLAVPATKAEVLQTVQKLLGDKAITVEELNTRFQTKQKLMEHAEREAKVDAQARAQAAAAPTGAAKQAAAAPAPALASARVQVPVEKPLLKAKVVPRAARGELKRAGKPASPVSIEEEALPVATTDRVSQAKAIKIPIKSPILANLRILNNQKNKKLLESIIKSNDVPASQVLLGKIQGDTVAPVKKGFEVVKTTVDMQFKGEKGDDIGQLRDMFNKLLAIAQAG